MNWNRQTYSLLDWLGDLGGLLDILLHIGHVMMLPIASFTLRQTLMSNFFRYKQSTGVASTSEQEDNSTRFVKTVKKELTASQLIPSYGWYRVNLLFCKHSENRHYKRILKKSTTSLAKELDLQKFLHRQRVLVTSLLGLLKGRQSAFVDYFSQLVVRESSDMSNTSEDDELDDWSQKNMQFVDKM